MFRQNQQNCFLPVEIFRIRSRIGLSQFRFPRQSMKHQKILQIQKSKLMRWEKQILHPRESQENIFGNLSFNNNFDLHQQSQDLQEIRIQLCAYFPNFLTNYCQPCQRHNQQEGSTKTNLPKTRSTCNFLCHTLINILCSFFLKINNR